MSKKQVSQKYCSDNSDKVRKEHGADGIPGIFNAYRAKINRYNIKGRIRSPLLAQASACAAI